MDAAGALGKIQNELEVVKEKLMDNATHLGMRGETLQRYLLQLNEKENLLLSRQIKGSAKAAAPPPAAAVPAPAAAAALAGPPRVAVAEQAAEAPAAEQVAAESPEAEAPEVPRPADANGQRGGDQHEAATPTDANGQRGGGSPPERASREAPARAPRVVPNDPPEGEVPAFNKEDVASVRAHMCAYEAVPLESARALRALASLSYASTKAVGEDDEIIQQLLRLCLIHPGAEKVQLGAVRTLCNLAYESSVARGKLMDTAVFATLIGAMAAYPGSKDLCAKASEAVARIVSSQAPAEGEEAPPPVEGLGALGQLFVAAAAGDASWHQVAYDLTRQLLANEVVEPRQLAERFAAAAAGGDGAAPGALGWLAMARRFSAPAEAPPLPDALVAAGAIGVAADIMEAHAADTAVQLACIETMSSLVGNRFHGLEMFAEARGAARIDAAMRCHVDDPVLQTKGVRALACAIQWPPDLQGKSGFDIHSAILLTKCAMSQHVEDAELQRATLEALSKYLGGADCVEEVKADGCAGMVKVVMTRHRDEERVQTWGKAVLDALGGDRHWEPRNGQ